MLRTAGVMMRGLFVAIALNSLLCVGLWAQGESLCDGDLCVPIPPGWTVWSEADVIDANPDTPQGHQIIGMAGEHPFGHPGPNAIMTLERLDLAMLDQTGMTSDQLAQMHFNQMQSDAGGFVPRDEVFLTRLGNQFAHGWQGTLTVRGPTGPLHMLVWQAVSSQDTSALRLTFFVPVDLPAPLPVAPEITPEVPETPHWMVGPLRLDLPEGWETWNPLEAELAQQRSHALEPRITALNGITRPASEAGVFQPSMVIATLGFEESLTPETMLQLVNDSAMTAAAGTLSGEVIMSGAMIQLGESPAAIAVVGGMLIDHLDLRPIRIDQLWINRGTQVLRVVHITDFDDESTRRSLITTLEGITL